MHRHEVRLWLIGAGLIAAVLLPLTIYFSLVDSDLGSATAIVLAIVAIGVSCRVLLLGTRDTDDEGARPHH